MTLSSPMAMYSVLRDIPDARKVPMERGLVALHLYITCTFSSQLTLEQWAFEYGLSFFFDTHCTLVIDHYASNENHEIKCEITVFQSSKDKTKC